MTEEAPRPALVSWAHFEREQVRESKKTIKNLCKEFIRKECVFTVCVRSCGYFFRFSYV